MSDGADDDRLASVAALGDRLRRALYRFVAGSDKAVSRDQAAEAVGVSRSAAAFHLDRLVDEGLVETEFRRLGGRRGPGAGRPSKLYRRAGRDISVSLPPRDYGLAADLLASAIDEATASGAPVAVTLRRLASERGQAVAGTVAGTLAGTVAEAGGGTDLGEVVDVLAGHGYEPRLAGGEVVLANCPFHALVAEHRPLVCGLNLALLQGFTEGLPGSGLAARLQPDDRHCCVRLAQAPVPDPNPDPDPVPDERTPT